MVPGDDEDEGGGNGGPIIDPNRVAADELYQAVRRAYSMAVACEDTQWSKTVRKLLDDAIAHAMMHARSYERD